jgi:hypothetical protein
MSSKVTPGGLRGATIVTSPPSNTEDAEFMIQFSSFLQQFVEDGSSKKKRAQVQAVRRMATAAEVARDEERKRGLAERQAALPLEMMSRGTVPSYRLPTLSRGLTVLLLVQCALPGAECWWWCFLVLGHYSNDDRDAITHAFQPNSFRAFASCLYTGFC